MLSTQMIKYNMEAEGGQMRSGCTYFENGFYLKFSNPNWNMGGGKMDERSEDMDMYTSGAKNSITAAFTAGALAAVATQF